MTDPLDTAFSAERYAAIVVHGSVASLDSFYESILPMDSAPHLEFLVIFFTSQLKWFWRITISLGAGRDHLFTRTSIIKSKIREKEWEL